MKGDIALWQKLSTEENFRQAWQRVKANMGSPGIDRVSLGDFEANLTDNLSLLLNLVRQDLYEPLPLLSFKGKDERELKIPAIRDRIVQEALLLVLQPIFDVQFLDCSYGYRPGRSAHKAIARIERNIKKGRHWIVDADIDNFFDSIDQTLLVELISLKITDAKVLRLIQDSIKPPGGAPIGIPQGMVLSPLLANIYLHPLDEVMVRSPGHYIRYADDILVLCLTEEEARTALDIAREILEKKLYLRFNEDKTRICSLEQGFVFLGYHFTPEGKRPTSRALDRLKAKIEQQLSAAQEIPPVDLAAKLKSIMRGWLNYFQMSAADQANLQRELDAILDAHKDTIPAQILKAALLLQSNEEEKAKEIVLEGMELPSTEAELYYQWGILCQALQMEEEARENFYQALKIKPDHKEAIYHLGVALLRQGKMDKAIRYLQRAVQLAPESAEAHLALGIALGRWGLYGAARKALARARELDPDIKPPEPPPAHAVAKEEKPDPVVAYTTEQIQQFLRLFSGREGVFAQQWVDNTGRSGYMPVHKPLSPDDVQSHLQGKTTLGLYLMRSDNTVKVGVIDIDLTKQTINEQCQPFDTWSEWEALVQKEAHKLRDISKGLGIPVYVEDSGWKGRHLWFFFSQPIRAAEVREFLKEILRIAGEPPAGIHWEIFPKQDYVSKDALGSLIKLPLGIHQINQRRALFLDTAGKPYDNQLEILTQLELISPEKLRQASMILRAQKLPSPKMPEDSEDNEGVKRVLERCNVIRFLARKAESEQELGHYERLTLLHTLGLLGKAGKQALHQIIGHCLNYDPNRTGRWIKRLKPYPVSCPRIREWLSDLTPSIGCYCEFPVPEKGYPSPVLYADPDTIIKIKAQEQEEPTGISCPDTALEPPEDKELDAAITQEPQVPAPDQETTAPAAGLETAIERPPEPLVEQLLESYIAMKKSRNDIELKIRDTEEELTRLFQAKEIDSLPTSLGNLTRVKKGDKMIWVIEL